VKRFAFVIFLAGCPDPADDSAPLPPPDREPTNPCVGFGLTFQTDRLGDASYLASSSQWHGGGGYELKPIATGGVERITVYGEPYVNGMLEGFDAAVNAPTLALTKPGPFVQTVNVRGAASGIGDLCVYDQGSNVVHDGERLVVRDVATAFPVPSTYDNIYDSVADPYPFTNWKLHAGMGRDVGVALTSYEGWRLVDNGMKLQIAFGDDLFTDATNLAGWDGVRLDIPAATTLRLRAVLSSGEAHEMTVEIVDRVPSLVHRTPTAYEDLAHLHVGTTAWSCFDAYADDGARILAAPYGYWAQSNVELTPQRNCVAWKPLAPGDGTLTVKVDDAVLQVPYVVVPTTGS
jgi:hypothetical protein